MFALSAAAHYYSVIPKGCWSTSFLTARFDIQNLLSIFRPSPLVCRHPRTNYRLLHDTLQVCNFSHADKPISFDAGHFFGYLCSNLPDGWGIVECSKSNQRLLMGDIVREDVPTGEIIGAVPLYFFPCRILLLMPFYEFLTFYPLQNVLFNLFCFQPDFSWYAVTAPEAPSRYSYSARETVGRC